MRFVSFVSFVSLVTLASLVTFYYLVHQNRRFSKSASYTQNIPLIMRQMNRVCQLSWHERLAWHPAPGTRKGALILPQRVLHYISRSGHPTCSGTPWSLSGNPNLRPQGASLLWSGRDCSYHSSESAAAFGE